MRARGAACIRALLSRRGPLARGGALNGSAVYSSGWTAGNPHRLGFFLGPPSCHSRRIL